MCCASGKRPPFVRFMRFLGFGILGLLAAAGFGFLFGYFVMLLWNWLMPDIFGLGMISFWQAFGLVILGRILFGGFPHPPHRKSHPKHWHASKCGPDSGDWHKWKYYGQYWKDEGEQAFQEYVKKKESPGSPEIG